MLPLLPSVKPSLRRAGAVTAIAALSLAVLLPATAAARVAGQTAPGSTTTSTVAAAPATTLTPQSVPVPVPNPTPPAVAAPVEPAPTTTTVITPPLDGVANVPGPPPPVPVIATPDQLALAAKLEQRLVTQSKAMDLAAEQYDQAQQVAQASAGQLAQIQIDLAAAEANDHDAAAAVERSRQVLHDAAVAAYVGVVAHRQPAGTNTLIEAYERGRAQASVVSALGQAGNALQKLRANQVQADRVRDSILRQQRDAAAARDAARVAADIAQRDAKAAAVAQVQLLATVSSLQGDVGTLVAAAQSAEALAAYRRFSSGGQLEFPTRVPVAAPSSRVMVAVQAALAQVGKPYVWGATGPDSFDCSGLTQWAWRQAGVAIPRVAADQQAWAIPVPISQLQPGDLVFFGSPAHHVGMYAGNGTMVDAPHSGATVGVVPIWWSDLTGFGRVNRP